MHYLLACFAFLSLTSSISQEFPSIPEEKIPADDVSVENGEKLFEKHCTQCHNIFEEQIGPPLAYIYRFYDYQWLHGFITNSQQMIANGDTLAIAISDSYDKVIMPSHDLTEEEIWDLMGYIKAVSETKDYNEYFNIDPTEGESYGENETGMRWEWWIPIILAILSILALFIIYRRKK